MDADGADITTRLQVTNGILNVALGGGASISAGTNDSSDITLSGSVSQINAALASLSYTGDTDVVGTAADALIITTNDGGNSGGGEQIDSDTVPIDITQVNDAPVNTVPVTLTVAEETSTTLGGISIADVDADGADITTRLQVTNGILNIALSGEARIDAGANSTNDVTIIGSVEDINATLGTLSYTGDTDVVGPAADALIITTDDGGNSGGGEQIDSDTVPIDITQVNDAPVNTVPAAMTVAEETSTTLGGISIADVDADGADITTRLQVSDGVLNVELGGGASISAGTNDSSDITLSGSVSQINAALASLSYTGDTDVVGTAADALIITTNDGGNSGGGEQIDSDTVPIDITQVNDAPVNTVPAAMTVAEETSTTLGGISIADVDADGADITTRLQVSDGVLNVALGGGASISAGTNDSSDITLSGSVSQINAALASLSYTGDTDVVGTAADALIITTDDGALDDSDTVQIDITQVNDAPMNTLPATLIVSEETSTTLGLISVADVDAGDADITTRLQVTNGILNIAPGGASISTGANDSSDITLSGSVSQINAALASLSYTGDTDVVGTAADALIITTDDGGNSGGGEQIDSDTVPIDITQVNDAPVNTVPATLTVAEETITTLGGISVADVDVDGADITTRLQVSDGVLNVALGGGASISADNHHKCTNDSSDITLSGSVSQINAALASLSYTGDTDVVGTAADALIITTNDGGNSGGGEQIDSDTVPIDITQVNDAPVNTVPAAIDSGRRDQHDTWRDQYCGCGCRRCRYHHPSASDQWHIEHRAQWRSQN